MPSADRPPPRWTVAALFAYAAFVVYGSLLPFEFRPLAWEDAWARFRAIPFLTLGVASRADWIANGVLYVPLGALATFALRRAVAAPLAGVGAWLGAVALATAVEFAQIAFPPRTVSLNDLVAEAVGAAVGVAGVWALSGWLHDTALAWSRDVSQLARRALAACVPAYILYSLFPFDVLLTSGEWAVKLNSSAWGAWWAPIDGRGMTVRLTLGVAEMLAAVPVGMAVASRRPSARNAWRGAWAGAAVGATIELGQFALYSGVSQGASVLTRALGAAAGAAWFGATGPGAVGRARDTLCRHAPWLAVAYLIALPLAGGWLRHPWAGPEQALRAWDGLRLMPFYYHYYTTEAIALTSLVRTAALFAPVGGLAWARRRGASAAATIAALLAVVMEIGKSFQPDTHPDPTNVLIAAAAAAVAVHLLRLAESLSTRSDGRPTDGAAGHVAQSAVDAPSAAATHPPAPGGAADGRLAGVLVAAVVVAIAATWPAPRAVLLAGLATALAGVIWRPTLALAVLPLAMPAFDLAPWSGRIFVDEFDLLCAGALSIAWLRTRSAAASRTVPARLPMPAKLAVALFALALLASAVRGALSAGGSDVGTLSHLHSPANGLRVVKGAAWALLAALVYRRLLNHGLDGSRAWRLGLAGGLALTVAAIVWERASFVDLLDFAADYRSTGLFSAMGRGGAFVECFLAVAASALLAGWPRGRVAAAGAAALFVASVYALLVTYSRNGYAALIVGASVALVHLWRSRARNSGGTGGERVGVVAAIVLAGTLATLVASGGFARDRLAKSRESLAVRVAHWQVTLGMRADDLASRLLGAGPGRFPERHLWSPHDEPRAAPYAVGHDDGNAFLRLGSGATVYVEQIVAPPPGKALQLSVDLRGAGGTASTLRVFVCRKWTLTSQQCQGAVLHGPDAAGRWQTRSAVLPPLPPPPTAMAAWLPIKLSLATPSGSAALDVDNVVLDTGPASASAAHLVDNGGFERRMDRWFFATDVDPPWHVHSLPVAVLFDQGWLGALAWSALLACAIAAGTRALRAGSPAGAAALAGLAAFLTSGLLNTLVDEPRFLWLLLMLCALCLIHGARAGTRATARGGTNPATRFATPVPASIVERRSQPEVRSVAGP